MQDLSPQKRISQKGLLIVKRDRKEWGTKTVNRRAWNKKNQPGRIMSEQRWERSSTCWALAWFWRRSWSRAAVSAGLASSGGIVGAAPRRPAHKTTLPSTAAEQIIIDLMLLRVADGCLPCLCPCVRGLSSILRAAGLLRPVSICMAVGSGRSPLPLFTALRGRSHNERIEHKSSS